MRRCHRVIVVAGCVAALAASTPAFTEPLFSASPSLVSEARKYMGTNPTARKKLWCATFMNMVLAKAGYAGTNSDAAKSFAYYGRRISEPRVGAIAVLTRGKRGGHVGVVSGIDKNGNPIIISGNHNKRVGEASYSSRRVIAYVMPTDRRSTLQFAARGAPSASELVLDSPIAELLAAINAEPARAEQPRRPLQPSQPPQPHRTLQQTAADIDPFLAELLERVKGRPQQSMQAKQPIHAAHAVDAAQPVRAAQAKPAAQPQRELRVQQTSGSIR
jgi:uncharacterized protein (TIGR02594 family)